MNNKEFINELSKQTNQSAGVTTKLINDTIKILEEHFEHNDAVSISGFGTFEVKNVAAREGHNPKTGETIQIPESKKVSFSASKVLKECVN